MSHIASGRNNSHFERAKCDRAEKNAKMQRTIPALMMDPSHLQQASYWRRGGSGIMPFGAATATRFYQ